jgi:pimeloyl-ACP methyl ester carboxylesterase
VPVSADGIAYAATGSGRSVVFLHGASLDGRMWRDQVAALAPDFHVVTVDRRGHGRSAPIGDEPTDPARDLLGVFDHAGLRRAALVGLSLGAEDAVALAGRYPERVDSLLLVGAWLLIPGVASWWPRAVGVARREGVEAGRSAWLSDPVFGPAQRRPACAALLRQMVEDNDLSVWTRRPSKPGRVGPTALEVAHRVAAPARVVVGELDLDPFKAIAAWLVRTLPGAADGGLVVVPGAGHLVPMEEPAVFNELLRDWLAQATHQPVAKRENRYRPKPPAASA